MATWEATIYWRDKTMTQQGEAETREDAHAKIGDPAFLAFVAKYPQAGDTALGHGSISYWLDLLD